MSFLWYWPDGGWSFDKWKSRQKWDPIRTQQSGDPKLHPLLSDTETREGWAREARYWKNVSDQLLGTLTDTPPDKPTFDYLGDELTRRSHTLRRLRYRLANDEWGYAWLLRPADAGTRQFPAIVAHHQTSAHGKYEAIGMEITPGNEWLAYGAELAEQGYVVFAPDAIAFGERQSGHANAKYRSADAFFSAHPDGSVMGKMAYDTSRAIDLLETFPFVDANRIGCIGHSHGGYGTLFAMVQDPRLKAGVISCGVTLLRADPKPERWWRLTSLIPRLGLYEGDLASMPIDFHHWLALVAPRSLCVVVGTNDAIFPNTAPLREALEEVRRVYAIHAAADDLHAEIFDGPHSFPNNQRSRAYAVLGNALRP